MKQNKTKHFYIVFSYEDDDNILTISNESVKSTSFSLTKFYNWLNEFICERNIIIINVMEITKEDYIGFNDIESEEEYNNCECI